MRVTKAEALPIIESMLLDGKTLQEVGDFLGVTREYVRQLRNKFGLCRGGSWGRAARRDKKRQAYLAGVDARCVVKYGCTRAQIKEATAGVEWGRRNPLFVFREQRNNAKNRGIGWGFDFLTWWGFWKDHWGDRGRLKDRYVMARNNDTGGYEPGNVKMILSGENVREAVIRLRGKSTRSSRIRETMTVE